nr:type I restriction enzyme HsdR N-terminal domain-containing protein [Acuticoccus kandeliae]
MMTEEAVKTSVVLPFLHSLGYDVFNPHEVIPEFTADAVGKKGEKVDYAIKQDGEVRILVECKPITSDLSKTHLAQLFRYFTVTPAKFAILTNGRYFHFHTDIEEPNKLDIRPFLVFDISDPQANLLSEIRKFHKDNFDVVGIVESAERLKYTSAIKYQLTQLMDEPTDEFVRLICGPIHDGHFTKAVRERFTPLVRSAFRDLLRESVQARLSSALASTETYPDENVDTPASVPEEEIVTTQDELEAFMIVKAIVRDVIAVNRVFIRDQKSYCGIIVDDNNRKPLTRLHFNGKTKSISFFDGEKEERAKIESLDQIYDHSERLRATAHRYVENSAPN